MNGLDLFTGIGGLTLALSDYVEPIAYCEIDRYCQAVILSRIASGEMASAAIWDDITTLRGQDLPAIDIIYGGFPCQDISCAGNGAGLEGKRSGLFFEIKRLANEIRPKFIFLENVPAVTTRGGVRIVEEITSMGYDCRWLVISAASIGALHKRERWFLLAHTYSKRLQELHESITKQEKYKSNSNDNIEPGEQTNKDTKSNETEQNSRRRHPRLCWPIESREHWQETVRTMGKCSDGIPYHVDRLRALGNAVVPEQAKEAFEILMGL